MIARAESRAPTFTLPPTISVLTLGILVLVLASVFTGYRARRPGASPSLRWLSIALAAAALALALWTVKQMVSDHRRDDGGSPTATP